MILSIITVLTVALFTIIILNIINYTDNNASVTIVNNSRSIISNYNPIYLFVVKFIIALFILYNIYIINVFIKEKNKSLKIALNNIESNLKTKLILILDLLVEFKYTIIPYTAIIVFLLEFY